MESGPNQNKFQQELKFIEQENAIKKAETHRNLDRAIKDAQSRRDNQLINLEGQVAEKILEEIKSNTENQITDLLEKSAEELERADKDLAIEIDKLKRKHNIK